MKKKKADGIIRSTASRFMPVIAIVAFACCITLGFAAGDYNRASPAKIITPPHTEIGEAVATTKASKPQTKIETVVITADEDGLHPTEITRPKGPFFLLVENRTRLDEIVLRLDRETGSRLHEAVSPRSKPDWADAFDLPPGRYLLSEAKHPGWLVQIVITAH